MTEFLIYGSAVTFALFLAYFVHHLRGTRRLTETIRVGEFQQLVMCPRCSVGSARPPQLVCSSCLDMEPRLRLVAGTGGTSTSTAVRR